MFFSSFHKLVTKIRYKTWLIKPCITPTDFKASSLMAKNNAPYCLPLSSFSGNISDATGQQEERTIPQHLGQFSFEQNLRAITVGFLITQ